MPRRGDQILTLRLSQVELAVVKAAISAGIEQAERDAHTHGADLARLLVMRHRVDAPVETETVFLSLDRQEAELLRACVTSVIAVHGYVVGRPAAVRAMSGVRGQLDRLLGETRWQEIRRAAAEILYGIFLYDGVRMFRKQETNLEHLFVLISFGDLLGVPVLPPYYTLRLLPFVVPLINGWRRRMLREKDLVDALF